MSTTTRMLLIDQFRVVDSKGERHTVSAWRGMQQSPTAAGVEFVPVVSHYKVDGWHPLERIDENTFRTESGEVLRRLQECRGPDQPALSHQTLHERR